MKIAVSVKSELALGDVCYQNFQVQHLKGMEWKNCFQVKSP